LAEILREEYSGGLVLALGGGAFVQPQNAEAIRRSEIPVVFLDAEPETLFRRCIALAAERPLLADQNQFRQLYEARHEGYMTAGVRVDTTALTPGQVAEEVARRLDLAGYS
jgi:shikimate kinase